MTVRHALEREDSPYWKGEIAACIGMDEVDNPHLLGSNEHGDWLAGFRDWHAEWDKKLSSGRG